MGPHKHLWVLTCPAWFGNHLLCKVCIFLSIYSLEFLLERN